MIVPLSSPFTDAFDDFNRNILSSCFLCSPYITQSPIRALVKSLADRQLQEEVQVRVLTDISLANLIGGATDLSALLYLHRHLAQVTITYLPHLHAKVFIADRAVAFVGSANFTDGGKFRNYEYGLRVDDQPLVDQISQDISRYASLGGAVTIQRLRDLQAQIKPLRDAAREAQQQVRRTMSPLLVEQERAVKDDLIRLRVQGRSLNAIFSETLLYLLSRRALTTQELHSHIRQIHPDLCDDTLDRVIDGKRYGKKWKHQVRGAQVSLVRSGHLEYDKELRVWYLVRGETP